MLHGELSECSDEGAAPLGTQQMERRVRCAEQRRRLPPCPLFPDRSTTGGPMHVARLVCDDAQQPWPEGVAVTEAASRRVGLDEGLLDDVLGVRAGAQQHCRS